jgi:hypothetical protein
MKINITKHYDKFTAKERIDLAIAAMARQDKEELIKLRATCPKRQYIETDAAYCGFMEHLNRVGISYNCYRQIYFNEISEYQSAMIKHRDEFMSYESGVYDAIGKPDDNHPIWQQLQNKLDDCLESVNKSSRQMKQAQAKLKALDEALKQFCAEIGVDFNNTRLWLSLGKTIDFDADIELDSGLIEQVKKDFYELWNN